VEYSAMHDLELWSYASAEAQVAAIADDIAYNTHDIDDGLRASLFGLIDLGDVPLAGEALAEVLRRYPDIELDRTVHETVRRMMSAMIGDVIAETGRRAGQFNPQSVGMVRAMPEPLVLFSDQMREKNRMLQSFLAERMYRHSRVVGIMERAQRVVRDLFGAYMDDADLLPQNWRVATMTDDRARYARQVCDFIAGMTDRYALSQHQHLFDLEPLFR
jgi:dGTPase